jgi:DNA polymerase-3 subunit epsilon
MLRENSAEVCLDESYLGDVEEGVISHYRQQGQQCWFTENKLWHVLFAFTCWPILYGREQEQYSDFDHFPAILKNPDFYEIHQQVLEQRLEMLRNRPQAMAEFTRLAATHYGMPTGLFNWSPSVVELLRPCLDYAPEGALEKVMRAMSRDYRNAASGYPDIMALKKGALRFEEVKAPGDSLRPNQLLSIERLRQAGFTVDICQVTWAINPDQVYAVVDIETTGGRRSGNSITEIAVVRIRDGEIISRWSTLINPGRSIPSHITRLTGINNQMVADAPRFVDIVDELDQQLADAIFVAHNVGFDYGFIKSAYETIGRKFKKPKLCTVQQSRKAFPGLRSYSLANLTAAFDIDLKNAHRALSDATATAHLLRLIQQSD